ncbi:DUF4249 domain-containing protein [Patiriisocius sp. Uisw_017]|jgi:hypothetical protein|uniref:DUF4249 domain-containing protein n=1 Tax=Patiriisocius sp. Uisw_017 TaxID=3230968 RepID=UPI0039EA365A
MKYIQLIILSALLCISCEDVIEVDLEDSEPRLVIEATINVSKDGSSDPMVTLTETAPFFNDNIPTVPNATVTITSETGEVFPFLHIGAGKYTTDFNPTFGLDYTLTVVHKGETYEATESLVVVTTLDEVEQNNEGGFSGEDIELKVFFTDPAGEENYYLIEVLSIRGDERDTFFDEFFDGNRVNGFYLADDLAEGDEVTFNLFGVDEDFYNFMVVLLQQVDDGGGGPFETQPATVKGNILNTTNEENFPLGYFRISEISTLEYTVQ